MSRVWIQGNLVNLINNFQKIRDKRSAHDNYYNNYLELNQFICKYHNVEIKKIFFLISALLFLNGCFQSTAMVGPAITFVSTGNIYQAGLTFGANKAVENETGMTTTQYVSSLLEDPTMKNKREEEIMKQELFILVKSNYEKTRKIILSQSLVKSNYEKTRKIILSQSNKPKIIN